MKSYKIGVFGAGRGTDLAKNFMMLNCEIVALCDFNEERLQKGAKKIGNCATLYKDFDKFIEHDGIDAVIVANYFHEHAPYAIKLLERGIHVFCECISNGTMAEGVELIRAAEKSDAIYFLAENYPQMLFNREIARVCNTKTLGKIVYAEGEYNHPGDPMNIEFKKEYVYEKNHWRNYNPRAYYVTHSLAPLMHATGANPKRVTSFAAFSQPDTGIPVPSHVGDVASIITTQNDDGSIFRVTGCAGFGGHHLSYRVCGTKGQIENLRGMNDKVMLRYNSWNKPEDKEEVNLYLPDWNDKDEALIKQSGHGGGDFITARMFLECIEENKQPEHPFDVYSAITMSSVAILAHRSMLDGGKPYDIPDFRLESERVKYENDRLTPYYLSDGTPPSVPCCSVTDFEPPKENVELFEKMVLNSTTDNT